VIQSTAFDWVSEQLEKSTRLSKLEARGTVRLVLKDMGLDPLNVRKKEMGVALRMSLGVALEARRVTGGRELCARLELQLQALEFAEKADSPAEIFGRLGRV
jgi:hypothetical protein